MSAKSPKNPKAVTLTVYQRLRDAAVRRTGMKLSAADVVTLFGWDIMRDAATSDDNATPRGDEAEEPAS